MSSLIARSSTSRRTSLQCTCTTRRYGVPAARGSPPANRQWPVSNSRPYCLAGRGHQPVDIGLALHDRAHVVMEGHAHAERRHAFRELRSPCGHRRPVAVRELRPLRDRRKAPCRPEVSAYTTTLQPRSRSSARCGSIAANSSATSRSRIRPSNQPEPASDRWRCQDRSELTRRAGNLPPSSVPP